MPSPRYWREIPGRYRLEAGKCRNCASVAFPKRPICPECQGEAWDTVRLSHEGKIVTSTVIHVAPDDFIMEAPYAMAIVETPEGARMMTQVVDCEPGDVAPGMDVSLEFRKIRREGLSGILCYGHKAVPVP